MIACALLLIGIIGSLFVITWMIADMMKDQIGDGRRHGGDTLN